MQEQRCDEVALVERLEDVDRVKHAPIVRMPELLEERLDRREVRHADPDVRGLDVTLLEPLPDRRDISSPRPDGDHEPPDDHEQRDDAQLAPCQPQGPRA